LKDEFHNAASGINQTTRSIQDDDQTLGLCLLCQQRE
jgi:hypothetical protein